MKAADLHCDTISEIRRSRSGTHPQCLASNTLHVDLGKMKKGGCFLQNFAMFVDTEEEEDPFLAVLHLMDIFYQELENNKDAIRPAKNYKEIMENGQEGYLSAVLTVEEGAVCKGDLALLRTLYRLGVRMMALLWNRPNELGWPNLYPEGGLHGGRFDGTKGLTPKGLEFLAEMERMGMIIDVSHLSDAGFWDVLGHTQKPFVASHSNARALCGHARNLTDEMIRALAERGGVIGLNYYGRFLQPETVQGGCLSRVGRIAEHARHIIKTGGRECLGLGSDFDGFRGGSELGDCSMLPLLAAELERQRFTTEEIEGIFYKNVLRIYKEVLK